MKSRFFIVAAFLLCGFSGVWAQGSLWGTASSGAADNKGVIFKTNDDGTGYTVMHNFITDFPGAAPQGSLTLAGGKLYGMTNSGGANNMGLIFEYDPAGAGTYTKKFDFSGSADGAYPSGGFVLAPDGYLYGLTTYGGSNDQGTLFKYFPGSTSITKKVDFSGSNGAYPQGKLFKATVNGKLYGMTYAGGAGGFGVIFEFDITGLGTFVKMVDFSNSDGSTPYGDLTEASSKLYGMTTAGGASGLGVLFEYTPGLTTFTKKVDFNGSNGSTPYGSLLLALGKLYGVTSAGGANGKGILFEYTPGNTSVIKKKDFNSLNGAAPFGSLIQATSNGLLYGMTFNGGTTDDGVIFEYDIAGDLLTNKFEFLMGSNGGNPQSSLTEAGGLLYGMTPSGPGVSGSGTLFSFDPTNSAFLTKLNFSNSVNGSVPKGGLVQAPNGMLYGLTSIGGSTAQGIIYEFDPVGNTYTKKADFDFATTGANPLGTMILANTKLYGMTSAGGSSGDGVIFEYDPGTTTIVNKKSFSLTTDGGSPIGSLVLASDGLLYGMTQLGGPFGHGVIFSYNLSNNTYTKKYTFTSLSNGTNPNGSLVQAANGKLYGTTNVGGANGLGVVFEFDITTGIYTKKVDFDNNNGAGPSGDLMQASNGKLYGMTQSGGTVSSGVIYEYDPINSPLVITKKFDFDGAGYGADPLGNLTEVAPGKLYGTTSSGGSLVGGVLFQFDVPTVTPVNRVNFGGANGVAPYYGSLLLVPGKTPQAITSSTVPATKLVTDLAFSISGIADSGLPVSFTSSDPAVASIIAGPKIQINGVGTTIISTSQYGNGTYSYAQDLHQTLTVTKSSQTIGFVQPASTNFGVGTVSLSPPTASSGLPVTYVSSDPSIASISGTTVSILKAGTVTITASQAGNASYDPAPPESHDLVINKASQTISFAPIPTKTYGTDPFTFSLTVGASSGLPITLVDLGSPDAGVISISGTTVTILKAGITNIRASQAGNGNYSAALDDQKTVTVFVGPQTITFAPTASLTFPVAPYSLDATSSSGLPVSYVSNDINIATVLGSTITILKAGTVAITASQTGNSNYLAATPKSQLITINKGSQTINFPAIPSKGTLDVPFALTATSSSGLAVSYASSNISVASVSGNIVTLTGVAGSSIITASQTGDTNYNLALDVSQTLTVIPKQPQTISFTSLPSKNLGDAPFTLSATSSSGLAVVFASSDLTTATVSGNTVTILKAGSVTITASQPGDANYLAATDVPQTLTIGKGSQTITFGTLAGVSTTDAPFSLVATASSGLPVSYTSSNLLVATVSGNTVTPVGAGTTTITANQAGDANYTAAPSVGQPLTVIVKQSQAIVFGALAPRAMGDLPFQLSASATSALPVSFTSGNTSIATISGTTLTIVGVGTVSITANQAGNGSFLPASPVSQNLVVQKGNQTISFTAPNSPTEGGVSVTLSGTSSSGLALSYLSITTDKISVSGTTATPLKAGLATVQAQQAGNASYNAATPVDQTFCIKPAKPSITVANVTTNSPTLTSSSAVGNIWLLNGTPVSGAVNQTHNVIKAGIYTVIVTIEGCLSDASAPQTILITGDLPLITGDANVYPNPAKDKLFVDLTSFQSGPVDLQILDLAGKNIHRQSTAGGTFVEVNVADQAPAVYILVASQGSKVIQVKYVKQ